MKMAWVRRQGLAKLSQGTGNAHEKRVDRRRRKIVEITRSSVPARGAMHDTEGIGSFRRSIRPFFVQKGILSMASHSSFGRRFFRREGCQAKLGVSINVMDTPLSSNATSKGVWYTVVFGNEKNARRRAWICTLFHDYSAGVEPRVEENQQEHMLAGPCDLACRGHIVLLSLSPVSQHRV
jgi:hypothetical protein